MNQTEICKARSFIHLDRLRIRAWEERIEFTFSGSGGSLTHPHAHVFWGGNYEIFSSDMSWSVPSVEEAMKVLERFKR